MEGTKVIDRYRIPIDDARDFIRSCERTEDMVRIKRRTGQRWTLRGVPARHVDVVTVGLDDAQFAIVERASKVGRYNGAIRQRYTLLGGQNEAMRLPAARLAIDRCDDGEVIVTIALADDVIVERYQSLRSDLSDYNLARIVMWHWQRYFRAPLADGDEIRRCADAWAESVAGDAKGWTLAEANRAASRHLYAMAVDAGYRKMTLRERELYELDGGQWQLRSMIESIIAERRDPAMAVEVEPITRTIEAYA